MKSRRGKVRRSLALFLALALIFTTFLGDVSVANAQEATETEVSVEEKSDEQEKAAPKEKSEEKPAPAKKEKPQEKPAPVKAAKTEPAPKEEPQDKAVSDDNKAQDKAVSEEKAQEKPASEDKPQAEPEKEPAAKEPEQTEVKDSGSESADTKTDDKAETPKDDASSKDDAETDKKDDAGEKTEKYTVRFTVNNSDAGIITVDGSSVNAASYKKDVEEGKDFRFSVTAKEGFDVESVKVESADVAKNGSVKDGYIVKEVKKNTEIAVRYKEVPKEDTEKTPETEKETPEGEEKAPEETEAVPEAVKAFLDAVAALPSADEVNVKNAEKIGEQVNAALDMWEAMDDELAEREDVQAALEKVYAVYEAVLGAEEVEDAKGYSEGQLPYSSTDGVTKSAFQYAYNLGQADSCKGEVVLNGKEEMDSGTPNVWATGGLSGSVNVTGYKWINIYNPDKDVVEVTCEKSGGKLIIRFKPGTKSGRVKVSVGVDALYPHYSLGTWNMNLNFDYDVTNKVDGEESPSVKPAKPTVNDVPATTQKGYVYVKCVTYPDANPHYNSTRIHAGFMSLRGSTGGWSFGEVYSNDGRFGKDAPADDYPWLCDLTLDSQWYLNTWNGNYSSKEGTHYLNNPSETVSMTFVSDGDEWYYFTEDVPLVVWITHKNVTNYTVKYTDGVNNEEVFEDQITSWLKEGEKTPKFKSADKGTVTKEDGTVEPVREGYTFEGWAPAIKLKVDGADADKNKEIIYMATWSKDQEPVKKITGIEKKLIKSVNEVPEGINVSGITYPNDGTVMIPDNGSSVTLLYKITVTGDPGKEYKVTDDGAAWVGGAAMEGEIPESGSAVIYVTKQFAEKDIDPSGEIENEATVTPGKNDESSSSSTEKTPADTPKNTTLQVTKSADKDSVKKGDMIVYTITVKNTGAYEAKNVVITDKLDNSQLEFIKAELGDKSFASEPTGGKYPAGNIQAGGSVTLTITAKVKDNVKPEDIIHNTADAELDNPADDVTPAEKDVTVGGSSLDVTKSRITEAEVAAGSTIRWRITVTNNTNQEKTIAISDILSNQEKITVTEDKDGKNSVTSVKLQADETKILYASYVTKDTDVNLELKNTVTVTPDDGDEKTAEDEGTKVVSQDRKITVNYVSDTGKTLKETVVITKKADGTPFKDGDAYNAESEIPEAIDADGHHYIKESVKGDPAGTINGDVDIEVIYTVDDIGPDGKPDGTPDKYQKVVTFKAINGTLNGEDKVIKVVVTLKKNGKDAEDGSAYLTSDQIPEAKPNTGYTGGTWTPAEPTTSYEIKDNTDFVITYDPQEKRTVTIFYVDEDGNEIMPRYTETKNYGDSYDVSDRLGEETYKDEATGNTYVKDRVEGESTGESITENVEIRVIYKLDNVDPEDPKEPEPENPTPEDPTPENPTPEDPTPENPTPENPTPEDPTPENPTPENPTPEDPTPENPTPEDPTPVDPTPTPVVPTPITPVTPTITPTAQTTPIIAQLTPAPITPGTTPTTLTPVTPVTPVITPEAETELEEQPEVREVANEGAPLANTQIKDEEVPLAGGEKWALVNFALMNLAVFESLMLLIGYFIQTKKSSKKDEEEEEDANTNEKEIKLKKKGIMRVISLPVAVISVIVFLLTENFWLSTKLVDEYTLLMAVIAIFQTVVVALSRKEEKEKKPEEEPEPEMA